FLLREGEPEAVDRLAKAIEACKTDWDVLHLKGIAHDDNRVLTALQQACPQHTLAVSHRYISPYLELEGTYHDYTMRRSRNFRKQLKRDRKRLEERGSLLIEQGETLDSREAVDSVHRITNQSWKSQRGTGLFQHPALRDFMIDLFDATREAGTLMTRFLTSNGERIAHEVCFRHHGRVYSYNSCFNAAFANASPGEVLTAAVLEEAWASGCTEYDMLRGDEDYKLRWSKTVRTEDEVMLLSPGMASGLYRLFHMNLKNWVRHNKSLQELDNRLSGLYHNLFSHR
ncbi:MAG: GNAT family N-acetyltransferase, partial [Verrucomicrobiota bacterium]